MAKDERPTNDGNQQGPTSRPPSPQPTVPGQGRCINKAMEVKLSNSHPGDHPFYSETQTPCQARGYRFCRSCIRSHGRLRRGFKNMCGIMHATPLGRGKLSTWIAKTRPPPSQSALRPTAHTRGQGQKAGLFLLDLTHKAPREPHCSRHSSLPVEGETASQPLEAWLHLVTTRLGSCGQALQALQEAVL